MKSFIILNSDKLSYYVLLITQFIYILLPGIFITYIDKSSYTLPFIIYSTIIIVLTILYYKKNSNKYLLNFSQLTNYILLFIILPIIHIIFVFLLTQSLDYVRAFASLLIMLIVLISSYCLFLLISIIKEDYFYKITLIIFITFFLLGMIAVIGLIPIAYQIMYAKPVFPFPEPSHYVLFLCPYFLSIVISQLRNNNKIYILLATFLLSLFITNLTFIVLLILTTYIAFGINKYIFLVSICTLILLLNLNLDFTYYLDRINFEGENLSTLVWLQGWDEAYINFKSTYGLGLGFQQLGVAEPSGNASNAIYLLMGDFLNRYDGGTLGAKIISEFGILGLFIIFILLKFIFKSLRYLKNIKLQKFHYKEVFYHSCIVGMIIELFIRSVGYVGPAVFMFSLGIIGVNYFTNLKHQKS